LDADEQIDPLVNRPVKEVIKEEKEFGLSRFAINERILARRSDIDELLSLLSLDELKVRTVVLLSASSDTNHACRL